MAESQSQAAKTSQVSSRAWSHALAGDSALSETTSPGKLARKKGKGRPSGHYGDCTM